MSNRFELDHDDAPQNDSDRVITRVTGQGWNGWRCAGAAMLSLTGFVVLNVAGCGGGPFLSGNAALNSSALINEP